MPNIRESLYQCLENKVVATSTNPILELFTVDPSCQAYAMTIYVVYRNTSFLEINLNSGMIKNGNSEIGYYRIRQAALQPGEVDSLYLVPSGNGRTYYLQLSGLTVDSNIFVRKDIKFGTYSKLLTTIHGESIGNNYKLTTIEYDTYNPDKAYSNGYFVESNDHTFVRQLLSKNNNGILGQHDVPFENAYLKTITTTNILNSYRYAVAEEVTDENYDPNTYYIKDDSGMYNLATGAFDSEETYYTKESLSDKLTIGENSDRINAVYTESVSSGSIDSGTIDLGTIIPNTNERMISIGSSIDKLGTAASDIRKPKKSGFWDNGILEVRYTDEDHIFTQYVRDDDTNTMKQQIVVPGGLSISGTGNFTNAAVTGHLYLNSSAANANILNALYIDENGEIKSSDLTLTNADITDNSNGNAHNGGKLDFVSGISQDSKGKVTYTHSVVSVRDEYLSSIGDPVYEKRPVNSLAVKDAIDSLDVSNISGFGVDKTLATLTETDGKISATFQDITVKDSHVKVNEKKPGTVYPYNDLPDNDAEATIVQALSKRARVNHKHGFITADGEMYNSAEYTSIHDGETIPNGSRLLFADSTLSGKIKQVPFGFDPSTPLNDWKFLNQRGGWTTVSLNTLSAAANNHVHGYIENNGSISDDHAVEIANNDYSLVLTDDMGTICKSILKFNTSGQKNSNNLFKYLGENGQWAAIPTLSDLGGSPSDHTHHDLYVRHDSAQGLDDTEKGTARSNINAGRVDSVALTSNNSSITVSTGSLNANNSNPNFDISLPTLIETNGGTSVTTGGTTGNIAYDSANGGYNIQTPIVSVDQYGRVVQCSEVRTQTIQGHTADYSFDNGVLTITVR